MRGCDDHDGVDCVQLTVAPPSTVNYSDDEILQETALLVEDAVCADGGVAAAPRRKSADYGCGDRRTCFAPYSRLDVEHHPLSVDGHHAEWQVDCRLATPRSYDSQPTGASSHVDGRRFPATTTHADHDSARPDSIPAAAAWSRDDDVRWWGGDSAVVNCRRRFIDEQLAEYERQATRSASSAAATSRLSTPYVGCISDQGEFVVRRRDADLSSNTSSSSSSSPATRLLGRLAPQPSPPVADVIPPSQRLPPTSLRARKREQATRARSAAEGGLRRSNSVAGSSAGPSLHSGDEGFADCRTRTPEPRRMSGSERNLGETCCVCRETDSGGVVAGSQSNVSSAPDQARKRSYRVGLNLFNKYVTHYAPFNSNLTRLSYDVQSHPPSVSLSECVSVVSFHF